MIVQGTLIGPTIKRFGPSEQGQLQGANASLMGIASLLGPGLFTQVFARSVGPSAPWHLPGAPFLLAASLLTIAAVVAWWVTARHHAAAK